MTHYSNRYGNVVSALDYLERVVRGRLEVSISGGSPTNIEAPAFTEDQHYFATFLLERKPSFPEYVTLLLALVPHLRPAFFDCLLKEVLSPGEAYPAFGGFRGKQHQGLLPTGETVLFIIGGHDLTTRLSLNPLFAADHWFATDSILYLLTPPAGEPYMSGQLAIEPEFLERVLLGRTSLPTFSPTFPAQRVATELGWSDLVLPDTTLAEIGYLRNYLTHHDLLAGKPAYGRHSRRGYRALFHGPPGTGKTLTAALLGKATDRPVFRVDLSMVVSKWIGETEKNLAGLFDRAESKGWILFFDEADALFNKRSEVKESKDKYANQETSFLLQRVEDYDGLCILASNFRQNLDKAFTRRFESIVAYRLPDAGERRRLWQTMLPAALPVGKDVVVDDLADRYELTGASIANAVRHCVYEATAVGAVRLDTELLLSAIRREYEKEDRLFPAS